MSKAESILEMLREGPKSTAEIATALDCSEPTAGTQLKQLLKDGQVTKANRMAPWSLPTTDSEESAPAPTSTMKIKKTMKSSKTIKSSSEAEVVDLELKLNVLDVHIKDAIDSKRAIAAFVLGEIRSDLERLAKAA